MAKSKKAAEAVETTQIALGTLITAVFADFEKHLASPQDVALFRRKLKDYVKEIEAKLGRNDPAQAGTCDERTEDVDDGQSGTDEQ